MKILREGQRRALKDLGGITFHSKETVLGKRRTDIVKDVVEAAQRINPSKPLEHFRKRIAIITALRPDAKSLIKDPQAKKSIFSRQSVHYV